jgi:hypothetical protein
MNWRTLFAMGIFVALVGVSSLATTQWARAFRETDAPGPSVTITRADDGSTVALRVGDRFLLQLGEEFNWNVTISDPSVVKRVPNVLVVRGAQGIYEAERAGETDVTATGVLNCPPNQPCPQLAALFRVHMSVSTALKYRVLVSQLARDGVDSRGFVVVGTVVAGPTCPVERIPPDPRCADRPVSGAEMIFTDDGGNSVGDAVSDAGGKFLIVLPAGRYTLHPQPVRGLLGTAPPQVILVNGTEVEVTLRYDTGIR